VLISIFSLAISIIDKTYILGSNFLYPENSLYTLNDNNIFYRLFPLTEILLKVYMLCILFNVNKIKCGTKSNLFFTKKNGKIFELLGSSLIYYSVGFISINMISSGMVKYGILEEANLNVNLSELIYLIVIAIFMLIISKILKNGYELKKENDLTI
jgi:hypothetical protein